MARRLLILIFALAMLGVPIAALAEVDGTGGPDAIVATSVPSPTAIADGSGGPVDLVATAVTRRESIPDGTGGAPILIANLDACGEPPLGEEVISTYVESSEEIFFGTIEPVLTSVLAPLAIADVATLDAVQASLVVFQACVARFGPAGGYRFVEVGITQTELIYLGIFDPGLFDGIPDLTTPAPLAAGFRPEALAPRVVYRQEPGRVVAVVPALQPGTDESALFLAARGDHWVILSVAPLIDDASDAGAGGGGGP